MSINAVEKNAQELNKILRANGKTLGKAWRLRIRDLLAQTFAALNAKPLDGPLCLKLSEQIEAEIAAVKDGEPLTETPAELTQAVQKKKPTPPAEMPAPKESARIANGNSAETPCIGEANNGAGETRIVEDKSGAGESPVKHKKISDMQPEDVGLFDLIHIHIRCFFKIRACTRPPYIGKFVQFADRFSEVRQERIDKFIGVLSKGDEDFVAKTEVDVGYRDDLIPDMPEMGFVLHPKKKKKY
ncbi:MAG: hypothetical protein J6A01_08135 [Proteobacteria bacterium]|nr:hypothetical protein [Pseudomonadota bacterium]